MSKFVSMCNDNKKYIKLIKLKTSSKKLKVNCDISANIVLSNY